MDSQLRKTLLSLYNQLMVRYGPQYWWPAPEPFEVIVGAILTQATAWKNAEKAIANLKSVSALSPNELRRLHLTELANIIRPCGYHNAKALKLKSLACWLGDHYNDNLASLFAHDIGYVRQKLLSVHGIGLETADCIILYATNKPTFVIDAYTRRIVDRVGLKPTGNDYSAYQRLFMDNLPADTGLFNEYHALLVCLAKDACKKRPVCPQCCLSTLCLSSGIIKEPIPAYVDSSGQVS